MDIGPPELLLILLAVLLLFGGAQLPKLAKNLGKAQRELKSVMDGALNDNEHKADEHKAEESKTVATSDPAPAQDEP